MQLQRRKQKETTNSTNQQQQAVGTAVERPFKFTISQGSTFYSIEKFVGLSLFIRYIEVIGTLLQHWVQLLPHFAALTGSSY